MVLASTQPISSPPMDNKENLKQPSSTNVLRNTNGRRPRSRTNNTPSPVVVTREIGRETRHRRTQSPPATPAVQAPLTPTHGVRFPVEDPDVEMTDATPPSTSSDTQQSIQLPRYLRRPAFKDISPAALDVIDEDLKGVPTEYIIEKLQVIGQQWVFSPLPW